MLIIIVLKLFIVLYILGMNTFFFSLFLKGPHCICSRLGCFDATITWCCMRKVGKQKEKEYLFERMKVWIEYKSLFQHIFSFTNKVIILFLLLYIIDIRKILVY